MTSGLEPYYSLIARDFREKILSGEYRIGDLLPSEADLVRQYHVSRMTARSAITELVNEGLVHRVQGKGAFVARAKVERHLSGLAGFYEDMESRGLRPESKVLAFERRVCDERERRLLQLRKHSEVFFVQRIRSVNGTPIGVQKFSVPVDLVPDFGEIDLAMTSFYVHLREIGRPIVKAHQRIEAVLDSDAATLLDVSPQTPFLLIEKLSRTEGDRPIELLASIFRGDKYSFDVSLG